MTEYDLTLQDADGQNAVMVTISSLGTDAGDHLATQAKLAVERSVTDEQVDGGGVDLLETLTRSAQVMDAGRYDGGVEVTLHPSASGVPLFVARELHAEGLRITDVSPQGEPQHLIVRAEETR